MAAHQLVWISVITLVLLGGSDAKKPLQTFRSYNVAHRGSSGEIPEETATSYLKAIEQGADFIETDILASQDGHLICFHDVTLDATTDITNNTEFAGRKRIYEVEGANITGWFVVWRRYHVIRKVSEQLHEEWEVLINQPGINLTNQWISSKMLRPFLFFITQPSS